GAPLAGQAPVRSRARPGECVDLRAGHRRRALRQHTAGKGSHSHSGAAADPDWNVSRRGRTRASDSRPNRSRTAPGGNAAPVGGDPVLLEWALESVMKNAIDALAGRDGTVEITGTSVPEGRVRIRVADNGPGVPRENRAQIFEPGFSTKEKGWGIGLSLARRIVRDSHDGELLLVPSEKGATFDIVLG